jgi:uncharacterized protein Usg
MSGSPRLRREDDSLARQLAGHQLTTAEILYHLPDYPAILQSFIWQEYDLAPKFPALNKFIDFWQRDIEGRLHRVTVSVREELGAAQFTFYADEFVTQ